MSGMSKVITAEYDAKENVFRLDEPPEGVADHARVHLTLVAEDPASRSLSGALSKEAAEEMAEVIDEMFPIER